MDAMKLAYPAEKHGLILDIEQAVEEAGLDYWYEENDEDLVIMVVEGPDEALTFAGVARYVADWILPAFQLTVYVTSELLLDTMRRFEEKEIEADYDTNY